MPEVGLRKAPQRRRKDNVKSHLMMDMKEGDNGFYEEKFSSRSRYSSKDKKKRYSTKIAKDENGLVYGEKWFLLSSSSSRPLEKDSSCTGMDRFWEDQCTPEGKDWAVVNAHSQKMLNHGHNLVLSMEGCQSPSASESSSSLSTRDSSSFSATSEASSARRESLQCTANPSARFSDFSFLSSHAPQLTAISMQKATGTDRTLEQNSVQSDRYEFRKQQKGQDLFKLRSREEKIVRNSDVLQSAASQQDKQNSYLDYSGPLGLDGVEFDSVASFEEKILIAVNDPVHASLECLDEGCSSDSSSSTQSWASAYSQEFSEESRWQSCNAIDESEDLLNHDDGHSNAACQTEGGNHIDFQHADIENVESFRRVEPPSSAEEVEQPSNYTFHRKSSNALRDKNSELCGSRVSTGSRICASLNGREFLTDHSEVLCKEQTFHMSDTLHPGYDRIDNATDPSAATFSTITSWVQTSVPNLHGKSGNWKSSYGHGMLQPAPRTIQPDDARLISTSQPSNVRENVTHTKAMDPEFGLHTQILDDCQKASNDCVRFFEKPLSGSSQTPRELPEAITNRLIPSSQSTLKAWSREKYPIPVVEKTSGLCKPLLPTTQTTAGVPFLEAVDHIKPLPSAGLKCRHSAAVKEKFPSTSLHGYVRFMEQGGVLGCTFFVNDSDEVSFARAYKPEKSDKENCDWIYTFHSRRDDGKVKYAWKGWGKKETMASELVGKMRVFHVQHTDNIPSSKNGTKETQFILFNARGQHSFETQSARNDNTPNRPASEFLKPVLDEGISPLLNASVLPGSQFKHVYQRATPNSLNDVPNLSNGNIASELQGLDCTEDGRLKQRVDVPKETRDASRLKGSTLEQSKTFKSHVELAAIVISTSTEVENLNQSKSRNPVQKETVGWGVKFLEKGSGNGWGLKFLEKKRFNNHSLEAGLDVRETEAESCIRNKETECDESLRDSGNSEESGKCSYFPYNQQLRKPRSGKDCFSKSDSFVYRSDVISADNKELERKNRRIKASVDVTVILPAGDHGLPTGDSDRPTPLVERWRAGGNCDCGGWDLGCGLSIFSTETLKLNGKGGNIALTSQDRINWISPGQPLKIFTQGYRREGVLRVEHIEAGLFSLRFQARFSPLQAFATAVAILHQQVSQR